MTKGTTVCSCGHTWSIHHKIDWKIGKETFPIHEVMGCLQKNDNDEYCACECFVKEKSK